MNYVKEEKNINKYTLTHTHTRLFFKEKKTILILILIFIIFLILSYLIRVLKTPFFQCQFFLLKLKTKWKGNIFSL